MKSAVRRAMSCGLALRPSSSSPRSISLRAPAPIRLRAVSRGTGGKPSRSSTKLSALIRSGAVSTSVPSRSNTMVGAEAIREALSVSVRSCKMGMLDFCRETADLKPADLGEGMRELSGKTAFVTGGASGIGLALGRAFAAAGMNVMLADVERSALDSAVNSLQHYGARVRGVSCDVTDPGSVDAATKFARVAMSEGLSIQLKPQGIGVSVLCPSFVRTRIGESGRNRQPRYGETRPLDPASPSGQMVAELARRIDAGLDPSDVAARVLTAIRQDALYVFTHPNMREEVDERFAAIQAAMDRVTAP